MRLAINRRRFLQGASTLAGSGALRAQSGSPRARAARAVALVAEEPGGVERRAFPVTVGIPFARGVLGASEPVALAGAGGVRLPLQYRVLEKHPDGSVRWLLADYQADFAPLEKSRATLLLGEKGPEAPRGRRIETAEQGTKLHIDNGVLELEIDRARCQPLGQVRHGGRVASEGGLDLTVTTPEGATFAAGNDARVKFQIEESGPLRLVARWDGSHRDEAGSHHFDFRVRLTVYAGAPFVRVEHILFNRLDPEVTAVRELAARLPIAIGEGAAFAAGRRFRPGPGLPSVVAAAAEPIRLEMHRLSHYRVVGLPSGKTLAEEEDVSMGWVNASGAAGGVLLAGKDFWQNYPKSLSSAARELRAGLIPDRGEPFQVPRGMAKSHTFFFAFHDGKAVDRALVDMAYTVQRWPKPIAPSDQYEGSGELWEFFAYRPKKYPRLEAALRDLWEPDELHFPQVGRRSRAYGLKNYGDIVSFAPAAKYDPDSPEAYYWNNEYDVPHVLAMMFLRSGDVTTWWGAEAHALHMMDVDTCYHESPLRRDIKFGPGGNVLASSPRQGPQAPPTPLKGLDPIPYLLGYQHFGPIPSYIYTWGEGLIDYYHVTGDRRALEVATGYARTLAHLTTHDRRYQYGLGRSAGWALVTMAMVYAVEPDPKIAAGAKLLVDTIAAELEPGRDRLSTIHPKAVEDRMITLTVRGLIRWHRVTGDAKTRKLIVDLMNLYLKVAFGDDGLPGGGTWPEERKASAPSQGFANLEALAYAYHLTGERRFFDAGVPALCRAVEWINHPTEELFFPRPLRGVFPFLAIADRLGVLEKIPGVGRWLAP